MTRDLRAIAESYFDSWKKRDFERLRSLFSENVTFAGPLAQVEGVEACVQGIQGLSKITKEIEIKHMWADEENAITWFELHTTQTSKPLSIANWMHIQNAKISAIRVTFDPRPLLAQ